MRPIRNVIILRPIAKNKESETESGIVYELGKQAAENSGNKATGVVLQTGDDVSRAIPIGSTVHYFDDKAVEIDDKGITVVLINKAVVYLVDNTANESVD